MTPNKRIFLNIVATYGRSLYALACGLFTSRWVLMALGHEDYGLYGVVGGLVGFVGFFNGLLSSAVGRFYAFAVGEAKSASSLDVGVEECRKWFNTALMLHTLVPIVLIVIGYPCGEWAVRNYLTIPPDRVEMCVWVWRFACVSGFVSMVNVPFGAMYTAKQEIAELTIYGVISTTANVVFLGYMVTHPGIWLTRYAFGTMLIGIVPQFVICIMAFLNFQECRIRPRYFFDGERVRKIAMFAGCRFLRAASQLTAAQGTTVLVNKLLGPIRNTTLAIGYSVSGRAITFSNALMEAFYPAITNAAGEKAFEKMRRLAFRVCLLSPLITLIFVIPLVLEIEEVLRIWLKDPPPGVGVICVCVLVSRVIGLTTDGCWMSVLAIGRIGRLESVGSLCDFFLFFFSALMIYMGYDILGVGLAMVVTSFLLDGVHLWYGRAVGGLSIRRWIRRVAFPILVVTFLSGLVGFLAQQLFEPSVVRVMITTITVETVYLPLVWFFVLMQDERSAVICRLKRALPKRFAAQ